MEKIERIRKGDIELRFGSAIINGENTTELVYNEDCDSVILRFMPEVDRNSEFWDKKLQKILGVLQEKD